jgi:hypothetical protein
MDKEQARNNFPVSHPWEGMGFAPNGAEVHSQGRRSPRERQTQ